MFHKSRKKNYHSKQCLKIFASIVTLGIGLLLMIPWVISTGSQTDEEIRVALVLGTTPYVGGVANRYFEGRMNAVKQLYSSGAIDCVLVSGDNSRSSYNEPKYMENALMKRGIPSERIYLDYAGFRTLDSIKRAEEVFGLKSFIIITQPLHAIRAQFIAYFLGLRTSTYYAEGQSLGDIRLLSRELGARSLMYWDILSMRDDHVRGESETIDYNGTTDGKTCSRRNIEK